MESPHKKRKIASQESQIPNANSTPQSCSQNVLTEVPSFSGIECSSSSFNSTDENRPRRALNQALNASNKENQNTICDRPSFNDLLDDTCSSLGDISVQDEACEDDLNYDEFFKTCKRIILKGFVWNLYKPVGDDKGSLYHLLLRDPRGAPGSAKWFVQYCNDKPVELGTHILYRFFFDCAGFQKFNLTQYFFPPDDFETRLLKKLNDDVINKMLTTAKFLFVDKARLAKILKLSIFNFLQKFILEADESGLLYGPCFRAFLKLLLTLTEKSVYRPLVVTAFVFVIKILTAICMVKQNAASRLTDDQNVLLDNSISVLYICFMKISRYTDKGFVTVKLACINELKLWIQYSPKVFVDHFRCTDVLNQLLLDESTLVRLAALQSCMKIVQNETFVSYLKAGPIDSLVEHIWGRVCDIDVQVQLKALEVVTAMITHYLDRIQNRDVFEKLVEAIYHKDYRMGSAAGKCVIEILTQDKNDERNLLIYFCKIAKKFHPSLKSLLVESCIDHTNVLQNWNLLLEVLLNPNDKDVSIDIKAVLCELFLESVHVTLTGKSSKARIFSIKERSVHFVNNELIANEIYSHLKRIIALYLKNDVIIQSIFKILVKIAPEYLKKEQCEVVEQLVQNFIKFFIKWNDPETLLALINYLVYVNQNLPVVGSSSKDAIEDLKKYVSEELYKSFKSRDSRTLIMAKKTLVVFSKFDLNEHIEWSKLLSAWTIIESNVEFTEDILASCHWSLMWRIKKLNTQRPSKPELTKEISLISKMSKQFFATCYEVMKLDETSFKFKAFERVCETSISFCLELENVCKQESALEVLKPSLKDNDVQRTELMYIFELSANPSTPSDVARFRKYIIYIYQMACLNILPMDSFSVVLKYYDVYYDNYGNLIEAILVAVYEKNDNWIPQLIVKTLSIIYQHLLERHGVVDVRSQDAKAILSLSRRFHDFKKIMHRKLSAKLLLFAVNYAAMRKLYDFLIYVRIFTDDLQSFPANCKEIINTVKERIPESDLKHGSILYFVKKLRTPDVTATSGKPGVKAKKVYPVGKKLLAPKLNIQVSKVKGKRLFRQKSSQTTTESEASDKMSLHDSSSDLTISQ